MDFSRFLICRKSHPTPEVDWTKVSLGALSAWPIPLSNTVAAQIEM
jgi:hypothetical protein